MEVVAAGVTGALVGTGHTGDPAAAGTREPAPAGALPSAWGGRVWHVGREAANGPAPCVSLNSGSSLLWRSALPPQVFPVVDFLTLVLSGCLLAANSSPLPKFAFQTPHSSTQPPSTPVDTCLRQGMQGCGMNPLCRSHSVLPATDRLLCSPLIAPKAPLLSHLISSPVRRLPWM